tara:strand:- start:1712 stop:1969 length:258 start_codon:yes stop_codon:yes gene_type:complete
MTKVQFIADDVDIDNFDDATLPTDVHLITFTEEGDTKIHAVRAYTKVDIFDHYYDKLKGKGTIQSIHSGFGRIRPNLYGKITDQS